MSRPMPQYVVISIGFVGALPLDIDKSRGSGVAACVPPYGQASTPASVDRRSARGGRPGGS